MHAAYWKYAAWRRLTGREARVVRPRRAATGSRARRRPTEAAWRKDVALLAAYHRRLRAAVAGLADGDLDRRPPGGKETVGRLVRGIAAHDLYHAGQIQLLKRMARRRAIVELLRLHHDVDQPAGALDVEDERLARGRATPPPSAARRGPAPTRR